MGCSFEKDSGRSLIMIITGNERYKNGTIGNERSDSNPAITSTGFFILAFLILSFAYELPLIDVTGKHRLNPRLFDIAAFFLIPYWLFIGMRKGWKLNLSNPIMKLWFWIVIFFGVATTVSILWIPFSIYLYSLFYFWRYLLGLIVLLIVASVPWDERSKRKLLWVALAGGTWVTLIAIFQFAGVLSTKRNLPTGEEISLSAHGIYSTLGVTYWHIGMFSVLSFIIGIALVRTETKVHIKLLLIFLTCFCSIPAFISGSRSGLFGITICAAMLVMRKGFKNIIGGLLICIFILGIGNYFYSASGTKERMEQETKNTTIARLLTGPIMLYKAISYHGPKLFLAGGGFYVVPLPKEHTSSGSEDLKYRKGYGNHNIFLFPLEQAGVVPFVLALVMWLVILRRLRLLFKSPMPTGMTASLARSMFIYVIALLIVGVGGQVFWLGFGTENFIFYQMIMFLIATSPTDEMFVETAQK
jgi:hypothetical protein